MRARLAEIAKTAPDPVGLGSFGMDSHVVPHFDGNTPVQIVTYPALREKLLAAKQVVEVSQGPAPKPNIEQIR